MIAILGATGFIGTYLVDKLISEGKEVIACGRNLEAKDYYENKGIPFETIDISVKDDFEKLEKYKVDSVVLLSALLPANVKDYDVQRYVDINVTGTVNVLEYCKKNNVKTLISTTSYADVQNNWSETEAITENTTRDYKYTGDHAVYVFSKNMATDLILHYNEEYGIRGVIFRLPPVYGVGPHSSIYVDGKKYISGFQMFVEKAIAGEQIEIYGDCNVFRDVVYVKDVVKGIILAIENENAKGLYNMGSGVKLSLKKQVEDIINIFGNEDNKSKIIYRSDKHNNSKSYVFCIDKAKKDFNYEPEYSDFTKLLNDYKKEMKASRFEFLIKRSSK